MKRFSAFVGSILLLMAATSFAQLPEEGENAPDFTLYRKSDGQNVTLSDYEGVKPVVLVFGSFT